MNPNWAPYSIGGATRPDSFTGMVPEMQSNLWQFMQAADAALGPGLQVYSGYRSPELQAQLYNNALNKYGSPEAARKWVAPPGRSRHNTGQAADLKFNGVRLDQSPEAAAWVRENASNYGLDVPMSWEPWQVELAGARNGNAAANTVAADTMTALGKTKGQTMVSTQSPPSGGLLSQEGQHLLFNGMDPARRDRLVLALSGMSMHPNKAVMANAATNIQDRTDARRVDEQKNRTIEALQKMGAPQQIMEIAQVDPALAFRLQAQSMMQTDKPEYVYHDGQWFDKRNPQAGPVQMPGEQAGQDNLSKDEFNTLDKLSDDATRDLSGYESMHNAWTKINEISQSNEGGVRDAALVTAFAKLLDPVGAVQQGEAEVIRTSGSLPSSMRAALLNSLSGTGGLPEKVRQDILNISRAQYAAASGKARGLIDAYQERASRAGLGGERVYPGSDFTSPMAPTTSQRPNMRPQEFHSAGVTTGAPLTPAMGDLTAPRAYSQQEVSAAIQRLSPQDAAALKQLQGPMEQYQFLREKGVLQ